MVRKLPVRYFPGKPDEVQEAASETSDSESEVSEENEDENVSVKETRKPQPANNGIAQDGKPHVRTLPKAKARVVGRSVSSDALNGEESNESGSEESSSEAEGEAEAEAESESEDGSESGSESEEESDSESESSDEELIRPVFISKKARSHKAAAVPTEPVNTKGTEDNLKEIEKIIQQEEAQSKDDPDDELAVDLQGIDDTDDLNPEEEKAAWKVRELKRILREREKLEAIEKEREELEARRMMSEEAKEAEAREKIAREKEEKQEKKLPFMQKYYHKGAYYTEEDSHLFKRDYLQPNEDEFHSKENLPKYLQTRDLTPGKRGKSKYRSLAEEDTGRSLREELFSRKGKRGSHGDTDDNSKRQKQ